MKVWFCSMDCHLFLIMAIIARCIIKAWSMWQHQSKEVPGYEVLQQGSHLSLYIYMTKVSCWHMVIMTIIVCNILECIFANILFHMFGNEYKSMVFIILRGCSPYLNVNALMVRMVHSMMTMMNWQFVQPSEATAQELSKI